MRNLLILTISLFLLPYNGFLLAEEFRVERFRDSAAQGDFQAIVVAGAELVHTTQLLPIDSRGLVQGDSTAQQTVAILNSIDVILAKTETSKKHLVKLNFYLSEDSDRAVAIETLKSWLHDANFPAVSFVQTQLPNPKAKIAIDAVIASSGSFTKKSDADNTNAARHLQLKKLGGEELRSHISIMPRGDAVYVSGQANKGELKQATRITLENLLSSIQQMQLDRQNIVSLKCFLSPMDQVDIVDAQIADFFDGAAIPAVSHVEWIAGKTHPIEIEMIASAPAQESKQSVTYFTPQGMTASPVYSRVARIAGDQRIYISGLYASRKGNGEEQTLAIFKTLDSLLKETGSNFQHLAKATYYVSDSDASSQLNQLRPQYYHPKRPPAASKAMVTGVGMQGRSLSIDIIAAPVK